MTDQSSTGPSAGEQVANALKLAADVAILPGSGQLVEGKIGEGVVYGVVGLATKIISPFLGPLFWIPWVAVGLDSFSKSTAGKHLWQLERPTSGAPSVSKEPSSVAP